MTKVVLMGAIVAVVAAAIAIEGLAGGGCWASRGCGAGVCEVARPAADAAAAREKAGAIDTDALKALLNSKAPVTLLDARTGKWDDGNRIPGAKGLAPDAAKEVVERTAGPREGLVVTYCASEKCPASGKLAAHLKGLGYKNVIEYHAGIGGWLAAGNKVEKAN